MAIHDLWSFDNAPQSSTDISAGTSLSYPNVGTYNQYTGLPGVLYKNTGGTCTITSDGFLNLISSSSWNPALVVRASDIQDWVNSSQYWIGFRTKIVGVQNAGTSAVFRVANNLTQSSLTTFLAESDMTSANAATIGTEYYVEIFIDRTNLVFQVYINGVSVKSGSITAASLVALGACYYYWGALNSASATANATRSFRDFYFLDVDAVDTTRLGPIRSSLLTLSNVAPADWTANGASSVASALSTSLESPPSTSVSASAPSDNQALSASLNTALSSSTPIVAVQPQASLLGDALNNVLDMVIGQASNSIDTGAVKFPVSSNQFNQRWSIQRKAPDGGIWTPAKVNASTLKLNPISNGKTTLLMHFDGANGSRTMLDAAGNVATPNGDAVISTAQSKIGSSSLYVDGINSSYVTVPGSVLSPGSGDWTVEFWVYPTTLSRISTFFRGDNGAAAGVGLDFGFSATGVYAGINGNSTTIITYPQSNFSVNNWYHIALVCQSGKWYLYVNGTQVATGSNSSLSTPTYNRIGGSTYSSSYSAMGYIDEMRVSNFARYTANFSTTMTPFVLD